MPWVIVEQIMIREVKVKLTEEEVSTLKATRAHDTKSPKFSVIAEKIWKRFRNSAIRVLPSTMFVHVWTTEYMGPGEPLEKDEEIFTYDLSDESSFGVAVNTYKKRGKFLRRP